MTATTDDQALNNPASTSHPQIWSAMTIVYIVWGSTYLAIAITIESMPPLIALGTRFVMATTLLMAFIAVRRGPRALLVDRHELRGALFVGFLLLGVGLGVLTLAERYVPSGTAALIVAVIPLWVAILRAVTGDRPPAVTWIGVVIGLAGIAILVNPGGQGLSADAVAQRTIWSVAMLGSTFCWALGTLLQNRIRVPRDPLVLTAYEMLCGAIVLTLVGLLRGEHLSDMAQASGRSWLAWAYLVTMGSLVAYTAYVWVVGHAPLSLVATYAYVNPVVAVLLGWLVLSEKLTLSLLIGGAVVIVGVALVVSAERLARRPG